MLVRISGGSSGIKEYLEHGQKQGRDYTRDELDERVILDGDLDLTHTLIEGLNTEGDRYLHITLAFKEDELSREVLEAITQDFQGFAFSAFRPEEYSFYAEAHLPRIKSYTNQKTGELVERKPHIHIVIPKYNLLTGEALNPFGLVERQVKYLEAFQEATNAKYGLASPKDNRRGLFTDDSELISRYKGDIFTGGQKELKEAILSEILKRQITRYDDFKAMLAERGEVKIRNEGKANEYLWLKVGDGNGINLRDAAFRREFIELPASQKRERLKTEARYETASGSKAIPDHYTRALKDWHERRAKEIKYVYLGKRKEYDEYKRASPDEKARLLAAREQRYYDQYKPKVNHDRSRSEYIRDNLRAVANNLSTAGRHAQSIKRFDGDFDRARRNVADRRNREIDKTSLERGDRTTHIKTSRGKTTDNITGQLLRDSRSAQVQKQQNHEFAEIKRTLDAKRLLNRLSHSHGVIPAKYEITKGQDGGDRIKAGTRNLNVSDFLTKELHLDYREAGRILRETYREQTGREPGLSPRQQARAELWREYRASAPERAAERRAQWESQRATELARRQGLKTDYERKRGAIRANRRLSPAERRAALSVARMERIVAEGALRAQARAERDQLKAAHAAEYRDGYRHWLTDRAQAGDEAALSELRRQHERQPATPAPDERVIQAGEPMPEQPEREPIYRHEPDIAYRVYRNGDVTYSRAGRDILADQGRTLRVLHDDRETIETGLRMALAKFGGKLDVQGSAEFKRQTAIVAAEKGLRVEFTDKRMNEIMREHKAHLATLKAREAELRALARQAREGRKADAVPELPRNAPELPQRDDKSKEPIAPGQARSEAIAEARRLSGRALVEREPGDNTRHTGTVLHVGTHHAIQDIGRNEIVVHELAKLDRRPEPGDYATVQYKQGRGQVVARERDGHELGR
jgi:hypothetical protein